MENDYTCFCENFDITDNALDMRDLQRWNGRSLRSKENLSEHTHLVMACAIKLYDKFHKYVNIDFEVLLRLAAIHDSLEILTGDILSVTKDSIPNLRRLIDEQEHSFYVDVLWSFEITDVEVKLVKLADVMACYKFMERELKYPANDFAYSAFNRSKEIFYETYENFCNDYNIKLSDETNDINNRFVKGFENDAGVDIVLENDVVFLPHSTTSINLNVTVTPKKGEMAVLCARTSAAIKGLNVAMCPIDSDYVGNITAIVHNISNNIIEYKKGESFCQWVGIKLSNIKKMSNDIFVKNKGKRTIGKLGSTGV